MHKVSRRGGFSDRNGIKPENVEIQLKDFDERTRVQIFNLICDVYEVIYRDEYYGNEIVQEFFRYKFETRK